MAKSAFGINYLFPFQRLVVSNIIEGKDQIVILPTGAGKSLCFSLPAAFLDGPTLIIFPLLALMADQARRLKDTGLGVAILRGGQSRRERGEVFDACTAGKIRYLISNPETLIEEPVIERLPELNISHMVIDEAHTVAEWGMSFRPTYLKILEIKQRANIPQLSAFTATASEHIMNRLVEILFEGAPPHTVKAVPDRPNITYSVHPALSKDHELRMLIPDVQKPAIIFCGSRTSAEMTAKTLARALATIPVRFYHAGLSKEEKAAIEKWFFDSNDGLLASTCAYGMGVDKANIRTVIHRDMPPSVEAYLQESGRAGRDRKPARAILLFSPGDRTNRRWAGADPAGEMSVAAHQNSLAGRASEPAAIAGKTTMEPRKDGTNGRTIEHGGGIADSAPGGAARQKSIELDRYQAMVRYAVSESVCRREYLLSLLSAEPEVCFGCDVCSGEVRTELPGLEAILGLVSRYPRRFTVVETAQILSGAKSRQVADRSLWRTRGYASLSGWSSKEVEAATAELRTSGHLKVLRRGPWKSRLQLTRSDVYKKQASVVFETKTANSTTRHLQKRAFSRQNSAVTVD